VKLDKRAGIRILKVEGPQDVIPYRAAFVGAYQTIFREPPYSERIFPAEAEGVLRRILQTPGHITLLAVSGNSRVVGFGAGVPLAARQDVYRDMHGLLPVQHTFYLAELGVLPEYRGEGLGAELVQTRLDLIDRQVYTHVLLRTSVRLHRAQDMYLSLGFEDIGVYQEVAARRMDGAVRTDRRLFLSKVLDVEPDDETEVG
jgi:ribosomal protein S18 acetylase RimI-like enzyme